jgi:membrane protein implicated in regulation of membrane protease activity
VKNLTAVYLFAAVVGWPLVAFLVLFGDTAESGGGIDTGGFDGGGDAGGGDAGSGDSSLATTIGSFFSLSGIAFFAAFFGLTGLLLGWMDAGSVATFLGAAALGVFAAWFHGMLIGWLGRTSSNSSISDSEIAGLAGRVSVPLAADRKGRIWVEIAGRRLNYVALPYRPDAATYGVGDTVVVIEVEDGVALVAPMDDLG